MRLQTILDHMTKITVSGSIDCEISSIVHDSRLVNPGDIFVAIREPTGRDGHDYIRQAIDRGAIAIIQEKEPTVGSPIPIIQVPDSMVAFSSAASIYFGDPASRLKMIGVTGTNGKTTVTYMIDAILREAGYLSGIIGTTGPKFMAEPLESPKSHTTPYPMQLHETLHNFVKRNAEYVVMEASSHGLALNRLAGIKFTQAVFTNLTRDHLDDHKTMDDYLAAKIKLFTDHLDQDGCAIINFDDPAHNAFINAAPSNVLTYGLNTAANLRRVGPINSFPDQTIFNVQMDGSDSFPISIPLPGWYNAANALAAYGVAHKLGIPVETILSGLEKVTVPGRLEPVKCGQPYSVLVDFAHTADALDSVLSACRTWTEGALIVVFGCGGDRDKGKRPLMAQAACKHADYVVITADNPRTEDIDAIFRDTEAGVSPDVPSITIKDREEAIDHAIKMAAPADTVLIAGKGDEAYQIINGDYLEFDDREVARQRILAHQG